MSDVDLVELGYEFAGAEEDFDADPGLATGRSAYWRRANSDSTYTQVTSTWGARCTDWDGGTPVGPFRPARVIEVINFRDLADVGGSEIRSDYGYTDLGVAQGVLAADSEALHRLEAEKRSRRLLDFPPHLEGLLRG